MTSTATYCFVSPMMIEDIFVHLNNVGPWRWKKRDSDRWGNYISTTITDPSHPSVNVKLLYEPDDLERYVIDLCCNSEYPEQDSAFGKMRDILLVSILPAIDATEVAEVEHYE
jgi:hypothetical protein